MGFWGILLVSALSFAGLASPVSSVQGVDLLTGQKITRAASDKQGLVIVFLSAVCPCSDSHIGELSALAKEYPEFQFVGVHSNVDEKIQDSKAYFEKLKLPFAVIQDDDAKLADVFNAYKTPHAFVMKADGTVVYKGGVSSSRHFDRAERKYLREALADLKALRPVATPEGRTLGCVISRGNHESW